MTDSVSILEGGVQGNGCVCKRYIVAPYVFCRTRQEGDFEMFPSGSDKVQRIRFINIDGCVKKVLVWRSLLSADVNGHAGREAWCCFANVGERVGRTTMD